MRAADRVPNGDSVASDDEIFVLPALGILASRHTALRVLLKIPLPEMAVPRVLGIDDFALRRGLVYATVLIDAETGRRVDVVPGRTAGAAGQWLRAHPGIESVCRDGSGAYANSRELHLTGDVCPVLAALQRSRCR